MPETINIELPDEPPDGSVVLDHNGVAWQRQGGMWIKATADMGSLSFGETMCGWGDMLFRHGPLTLIYRAVASPEEPA